MKVRLTVRVDGVLLRKVKAAAALCGEDVSAVIRRCLKAYVEKAEKELGELKVPE